MNTSLVNSAISFTREVTKQYGAEKGNEIINKMLETMPELHGEVFMKLIVGDYGDKLVLVRYYSSDRVALIKCIRKYSGLGLKEATDLSDIVYFEGKEATLKLSKQNFDVDTSMMDIYNAAVSEFITIGVDVR